MSAEIQQVYERPDYFGLVVKSLPCTSLLLAFWNEVLHNLLLKVPGLFHRKVSGTVDH